MSISATSTNQLSSPETGKLSRTFIYYAAFITLGLVAAALGPALPSLAKHTQASAGAISLLFTARSFGFALGTLIGGSLYDRFPGHPILAGTIILTSGIALLIPVMPYLWILFGCILILGFAQGMIEVGGNTLPLWVFRQNVAPFMNGLHFFFGVGACVSPLIMGRVIMMTGDINWGYWSIAIILLPVAAWILCVPSPAIRHESKNEASGQRSYFPVFCICLFFMLYVGSEASFAGWIYTYTINIHANSEAVAAYLTSAFWGALTLGRLIAIPLSIRVKPWLVLLIDFVGCVLSAGCILLWTGSLTAIWIGTFGIGLAMASIFPTLIAFAEPRIQLTGKVNGLFFASSSVGGMSVPLLIGQVFDAYGPQAIMYTIMGDAVVTLIAFSLFLVYSNRHLSTTRSA